MNLKDEFTFKYKNQIIKVKLIGEVYCAISKNSGARPLKIEIYEDGAHKGKISTWDGTFLSFLPSDAIEGTKDKRTSKKDLIKIHNLPLFCEICLNDDKKVLEVHHIKEHAVTADDSKENLRVYCSSCHTLVHAIRTIQRRAVLRYREDLDRKAFDNDINKKLN